MYGVKNLILGAVAGIALVGAVWCGFKGYALYTDFQLIKSQNAAMFNFLNQQVATDDQQRALSRAQILGVVVENVVKANSPSGAANAPKPSTTR